MQSNSPVLRSLARLRPDMTLEDGVPRAVQEWEHSSNFERMIFYEMAEKFMEFEAEEEQQIQKMKLLASCSQFQAPKPTKMPTSPAPESGQQQVYIPKKSASRSRQPRRRQRRPPSASVPGAPREIPAEAVHQYAEIMEGLDTSWEEEEEERKEPGVCRGPQDQDDVVFPDPALLQYIDQLCDNEEFVCKVEAVIHPQFMADLLSPEKSQDPLNLLEELAEELNLTPNQLTEKRLLALSEEEREPSVCPTSHSDSTPSQSEEEDEVSGNGKGEDPSHQAIRKPSTNKSIRSSQPELSKPVINFPLALHSHQQLGDREFPQKCFRDATSSCPHELGSHDSQERNLPCSLRNTEEGDNRSFQGQAQVQGHIDQILPHVQWVSLEAAPNKTGNSLTKNFGAQEDSKAGREISVPYTMKCSKQDGSQEGKVKGQEELPTSREQGSHGGMAQFQNRIQLSWTNLESDHKKCGKQVGSQQGENKCPEKSQATWEVQVAAPKETDNGSQGQNKILLGEHASGERALKLSLNGHEDLNVDIAEEVIDQFQIHDSRKSEDTTHETELDCQGKEQGQKGDKQGKQGSQELLQLECANQDGCQGKEVKDIYQVQAILAWPNSTRNGTATQFGSKHPCSQSLETQDSLTLALPRPGNELASQEAKVKCQKKPQVNWKQAKTASLKDDSSNKSRKLSEDKVALHKQPMATKRDGHESTDPPVMVTDQEINLKSHVELSRQNEQQLTLAHSSGVEVLEERPQDSGPEKPPCFTFSEEESSSSHFQKGSESSQKSRQVLMDHCKNTPLFENLPDDKQDLKSTLNPSGCSIMIETDGASCSPSDHTRVPTTPSKEVASIPQLSLQKNSTNHENDESSQRLESSDLPSSKVYQGPVRSKSDMQNLSKVRGDLLESIPAASNKKLPELPARSMEGILKEEEEEEEEEEDEELSSFSSLLASKLSLSPHGCHLPLTTGGEDTKRSPPTDSGKQSSKMRHSIQGQMPQNSPPLPDNTQESNLAAHRSHKRKSSNSGPRRSKRLRNQ
ncbi:NUT family member 1 [Varanus komodoensis]|uniref:NUT family member 1 n=1 Tax=Varanus komodoensis TaxID=61221 RepID=UPI001CF7CB0B|nr:NUT family member 1 [Varanus komodoensis]